MTAHFNYTSQCDDRRTLVDIRKLVHFECALSRVQVVTSLSSDHVESTESSSNGLQLRPLLLGPEELRLDEEHGLV